MIEVYPDEVINDAVAAAASKRPEFKAAAAKVYAEVLAAASAHNRTGELAASFSLHQGRVDWRIEPDTDYDAHAEFGHYVYYDAQGNVVKRAQGVRRVWVEGVNIMRGVVAANGGF